MSERDNRSIEEIENDCIVKGIKMTYNRRIVLCVVNDSTDHPTAEEVYKRASEIDSKIGLATVYRALGILSEHNIIEKLDFSDGKARYEIAGETKHHHHLINIISGEVIEFYDEELEKLKADIAKRFGYRLVDHKLELYGVPEE